MMKNKGPPAGDSSTQVQQQGNKQAHHNKKPRQNNAPTAISATKPGKSTAANITQNHALSNREKSLINRENAMHARDGAADKRDHTADRRDSAAHEREHDLRLRETDTSLREKAVEEAASMKKVLENHIVKLRQANGRLVIATVQAQTMAEEVEKAKDHMHYMAHHDYLTNLPNRILLKERLLQTIAVAKRHKSKLAVLFLDLDRFKTINDSLGHDIGDALLQLVAERLMECIRDTDSVSRQGGDEFVVLLSEAADESAVANFAEKISLAIAAPYTIAEQELHVGLTIGISMYPDDGEDAEILIRNADVAMYHAKNSGRGRYHFFKPEMNARAIERQKTEGDLHRALKHHEFELYYQAQVDLHSGSIIGVEALIRWHHPVRGLLLPALFIPIAEDCGAIVPIGHWVLREACRQAQTWLDAGLRLQGIAVNVSAVEFSRHDFLDNLRAVLQETGLAPRFLELELTESMLMHNTESAMTTLNGLKAMGICVAIDDFGTGYSSLSYLKKFPVDTLKIDKSFVAGIDTDNDDDVLVNAVIGLGKSLKHRVIAEGVETHEQLRFLSNHQCVEGQGFHLSRPMIAAEFTAVLKSGLSTALFPHVRRPN